MTDPHIAATRYNLRESLREIRAAIDGLPGEALNWRPAGDETNSFAVLATHVLGSTRSWLCVALDKPLPERDRDSEFRASAGDTAELLAFIDRLSEECLSKLADEGLVDWAASRKTHARPGNAPETVPAAWALQHAMSHLREHVAHLQLSRQLWDARQ